MQATASVAVDLIPGRVNGQSGVPYKHAASRDSKRVNNINISRPVSFAPTPPRYTFA